MFGVVGFLITRNRYMILVKYGILLVFIPRRQKANKEKKQDNLCCHLVTELCLTLCNPMDCVLHQAPLVYELLQAILEWVAIPFSRGTS